uniref:SHOCT domain-containing protein n=1 Tax=Amphimedon queenslandica TaxID=400682 RepID=A0A1X7VTE4_AMPQE
MIISSLHESYDTPPDIPAFTGSAPKKLKIDTMSDALTNAAVAFANAFNTSTSGKSSCTSTSSTLSPSKSTELRMKNYEQLRYLQNLYDDGILTESEYTKQKENILLSLRNLC